MKIVSIVGARPQFIKAATVSRKLRANQAIHELLLHTGQHYDENMSDIFFRELNIPEPDFNLEVGSGSHARQTGIMLRGIEDILIREKPDLTLVYGDTNSTLAGALAAVKLHIPVAHVEAGLRSFNRNMPEEINRIVTDRISDLLFAPTLTAIDNLKNEGLSEITYFTGDVMYDSVLFYKSSVLNDPAKFKTPGIPQKYLLATIHRAENTDNPENLKKILAAFSRLSFEIIVPLHPRTLNILDKTIKIPSHVHIIEPVGYLQMLKLTLDAHKVLTDSGGLQKEAYFLGKPCITLRTETEWVETLHDHWNIVTGCDTDLIVDAVNAPIPAAPRKSGFGDGHAADIILEKLLS
ncbi:MAG: UDP-N-acetylglucosamine 2-epimerase (non-hydrolyzing) [Bacteroidales bacterium]|jgi:UDP-GlcNAc3NAcA epimerase|nr:UDP-N-acetylglucosamine 2-epimerase (non-hydrolyzing) [Bacteroidales bacterium]